MPKARKAAGKNNKQESIEATLWQSADKLRKNMDAAEYKHVVLGLIFLKYISDAFEVLHSKLVSGKGEYEGADPEDPNEYTAEKVFFVPPVACWKYGIPPAGNANYAWIQHFIYHMSPTNGMAGFVLAKGSLTSKTNAEGETRKAIIEAGILDCIVNLPAKLFLNTQIPACLWFLSRRKEGRLDKVLFIDARNLGYLINRRTKDFTDEDLAKITETYHHWHNKTNHYEDVPGFCKSVSLAEIREKDYVLTPGRYIGLPEDEDDFDFAERFGKLKVELDGQMKEEVRLNALILENLGKVKLG